ncbi:hypothetical protein [Burkholderia ambifaria]|uniref:hypothetical protein n=1 Tax=Burkholderia ambifaria TaxID=152480 RepID=UPI000F7FD837|nr:hypothetical protein [Burkholderia ambifaria]
MEFHQLNDGCVVTGRCGRAGRDEVEWESPRQYTLYVQKDPKGRNCTIAIRDRDDFAEFDPRHDQEGDGLLLSEDYYFEVTEVISNPQ